MYCRFCGAQIPDDSRFCENCGSQLGAPSGAPGGQSGYTRQAAAPAGQGGYASQEYGQTGFPPQTGSRQGYGQQENFAPNRGMGPAAASGALLMDAGKMTRYNGKGAVGPVTGSGTLTVFDDRLEYKKTTGDQRGFMFGPIVGNLVMRNGIKNNPVDVYYYRDITSVTSGKYAGLTPTLVLNLRDGKAVSFIPAGKGFKTGDRIAELRSLIQRYL